MGMWGMCTPQFMEWEYRIPTFIAYQKVNKNKTSTKASANLVQA